MILCLVLSGMIAFKPGHAFAQSTPPTLPATWKARWWETELTPPATVSAAPTPPVTAAATNAAADWWLLVHQSLRDGNWEIYRGTVNNYAPVRLTYQTANDLSPRLNPLGTRIVFVSNRDGNYEIYVMNADGSGQTRLTNSADEERAPVWSPDGTQLLYTAYRKGNPDLYIMNADGSGRRQVTTGATVDFDPHWSPDGAWIVFVRAVDDREGKLWLIRANGSDAHPLTDNLRYVAHPVWSPDGTQIAFDYDGTKDYLNDIALINADGSGLHLVHPSTSDSRYYREYQLNAWGPDGQRLLYSYVVYEQNGNQLLLSSITLAFVCLNITDPVLITYCQVLNTASTADYAADVRLLDKWPPVTRMQPLPLYTRKPYVTVNWTTTDVGPAGVASYAAFSWTPFHTEWVKWQDYLKTPSATFYTTDNGKFYFQARAYDRADNWEAPPTDLTGSAETNLFSWLLGGQVTDARGIPQPRQPITIQPAPVAAPPTNLFGKFTARLADSGDYLLNTNHRLTINTDQQLVFYQHPTSNLLRNGDFEEDLTGWQSTQGRVGISMGAWAVAGRKALQLGKGCGSLCVRPALQDDATLSRVVLAADTADNLHVVGRLSSGALYYRHRAPNGQWDPTAQLPNDANVEEVSAVVDRLGTLWVVWSVNKSTSNDMPMSGEKALYYSRRLTSGEWSAPAYIVNGSGARIAVDSRSGLHLLYRCSRTTCGKDLLQYRSLAPNGGWSADTTLALHPHFSGMEEQTYSLAITPDDVLHVLYPSFVSSDQPTPLLYQLRLPTGQWSNSQPLADLLGAEVQQPTALQLVADSQGNLHLYWFNGHSYYASRTPGEQWSTPEVILPRSNNQSYTYFLVDEQDTLHLVSQGLYRTKSLNQVWSVPQPFPISFEYYRPGITVGPHHALYFTSSNIAQPLQIHETTRLTTAVTSAISQTLTLPADLHQPTLAFLYALQGGGPAAQMVITVTAGLTATTIFSTATNTTWRLGWADLTPWQGQPITLTIAAIQPAGEVAMQVYLDDLWVGAWQTPVAQGLVPAQVAVGLAATLTISGVNFMATPLVKIGEVALANVQWVNDHTLQADLPVNLAPGIYDLWVTNPSGETSVRPSALQVGKQFFLPIGAR